MLLHICNYDDFFDQETGSYAKFMNRQIKNGLNDIPSEKLQDTIYDLEEIIKQTKIENGLISTETKIKSKSD